MVKWIKGIIRKVRDYDRMERDYRQVLGRATGGRSSHVHEELRILISQIQQEELQTEYETKQRIKENLLPLLNGNKDKQLKEYVNSL